MAQFHLALIVPEDSPVTRGEDLWTRDRIGEALIALPPREGIYRHFQQQLTKRGVDWFTSIEVSSLRLTETYVVSGFGIGLGLDVPGMPRVPGVRVVALEEFPPVSIGMLWVGKRTPLMDAVVAACHRRATELSGN